MPASRQKNANASPAFGASSLRGLRFARYLAAAGVSTIALLGAVQSAHADAITYTDGGNVWVASPDGSVKKQLTTNATADLRYFGPSQADDGRIAVIFGTLRRGAASIMVLSPTGAMQKTGLLQLSTCGAFGQFPSAFGYTRIDPSGSVIAYDYLCTNTQAGGGTNVYVALTSANSPGGLGDPLQLAGIWRPNWLPSRPAGAAAPDMIATSQGMTEIGKLTWITPPLPSLEPVLAPQGSDLLPTASMSRTGNVLAYSVNTANDVRELYVARLSGPFGQGVGVLGQCLVATSNASLNPSISPDGKRVAWDDAAGAKVAAVDIPAGSSGGPCGATPTTISGSGRDPVFSGAAAPTSGGAAGSLTVRGPSKASRSQIRRGLSFSTRCSKRCTVKGTMTAGGKTVARATRKLKRKGTAKLLLKARLAASVTEVTVVVSSAGKSATRTITVSR